MARSTERTKRLKAQNRRQKQRCINPVKLKFHDNKGVPLTNAPANISQRNNKVEESTVGSISLCLRKLCYKIHERVAVLERLSEVVMKTHQECGILVCN